jgi:uncharacterized protein YjbI with pentapeptide repeats
MGINFFNADCQEAYFRKSNCARGNFSKSNCERSNFIKSHCENANFSSAICKNANFRKVHCQKSIFRNAICNGIVFRKAHCEEIDFTNAICEDSNFSKSLCKKSIFFKTHCEQSDFRQAECQYSDFRNSNCEGSIFRRTLCEKSDFRNSHCKSVDFRKAHCENANFSKSCCEKSNFSYANCEGTIFNESKCEGARFTQSWFDEKTQFISISIDDSTNFRLSSLEIVKIEPGKRAKLEQNIRRFEWHDWYINGITKDTPKWLVYLKAVNVSPVRFFWWLSDYGYSTKKVLLVFLLSILFFAGIYTYCPQILEIENRPFPPVCGLGYVDRYLQMVSFAASTMVTLGFSNINVAVDNATKIPNGWGLAIVSLNLVWGYFLLAVLVTRLGIMFQTLGPGYVVPKKRKGKAEKAQK